MSTTTTVQFRLPDLGEGVAESEIVKWLVQPGDAIVEDQPMVEVMTDKATVEIPAPAAGTISAVHAAEGDVVPVGTVIVEIEASEEAAAAAAQRSVHDHPHGHAPAAAPAPAAAKPAGA